MEFKRGGIRLGKDVQITYVRNPVEGLVATSGVVYTPVATFGTTAVEILNTLINPGYSMVNQQIEVGLTQQFTGQNGSFIGSVSYYWEAREEYTIPVGTAGPYKTTGSWLNITGTYNKQVGTLVSTEDTFSGYVPVASLPRAPIRLRLMAVDEARANAATGRVKNSSYIKLVGVVIPGA